jgi:hypothetical protein
MNKTQLSVSLAALFLGASGMVFAADTTTTTTIKEPLTQSATSVEKNITRDSDSKGLNNASTHLETNQDKIEARKAARAEKRLDKAKRAEKLEKAEKAEKVEKVERVEKAERPEKVERVEKAERPEKVERVEKVERPEKVK